MHYTFYPIHPKQASKHEAKKRIWKCSLFSPKNRNPCPGKRNDIARTYFLFDLNPATTKASMLHIKRSIDRCHHVYKRNTDFLVQVLLFISTRLFLPYVDHKKKNVSHIDIKSPFPNIYNTEAAICFFSFSYFKRNRLFVSKTTGETKERRAKER